MKIETTNALDGTITIDEAAKKVTIAFTTLRAASFSSVVSLDTTITPNGINIDVTKVGAGTVGSVVVSLSAIPSGTYGAVNITTLSSGRTPNPSVRRSSTFNI